MRLFIAICALSLPTLTVAQTTNPYRGNVPPLPTADAGLPAASDGLDLGSLGGLDSLPALNAQEPFDSRSASPITPSVTPSTPRVAQAPLPPAGAATLAQPAARATNPYANSGSVSPPASRNLSTAATSSRSLLAQEMIAKVMQPPQRTLLGGSPVSLGEVVASTPSRSEQTRRVEVYWDLSSQVADYYLSLRELEELNRLLARTGSGSRLLNEAVAAMRVRVDTSRHAAVATQRRLASMLGLASLPLPSDLPHVGGYDTRYQEFFGRNTNSEASELNSVIPARHAELLVAAQRVNDAEDWLASVAAGPSSANSAEAVVRAMELLALSRRAFVQLAKDYNRRIAHYTELSRPGELPTARLVSMLILTNKTAARTNITPLGPRSEVETPAPSLSDDWQRPALAANRGMVDERFTPATATTAPTVGALNETAAPAGFSDAEMAFQ